MALDAAMRALRDSHIPPQEVDRPIPPAISAMNFLEYSNNEEEQRGRMGLMQYHRRDFKGLSALGLTRTGDLAEAEFLIRACEPGLAQYEAWHSAALTAFRKRKSILQSLSHSE